MTTPQAPTATPLASANGSASERSADEWATAGRKAANMAMDETEHGHFGCAEDHRKTMQLCFDMELKLRQMQNAPLELQAERKEKL